MMNNIIALIRIGKYLQISTVIAILLVCMSCYSTSLNTELSKSSYFFSEKYACSCGELKTTVTAKLENLSEDGISNYTLFVDFDNRTLNDVSLSLNENRLLYFHQDTSEIIIDFDNLDSNFRKFNRSGVFAVAVRSVQKNSIYELSFEPVFLHSKFISSLSIDEQMKFVRFGYYDGLQNWICNSE